MDLSSFAQLKALADAVPDAPQGRPELGNEASALRDGLAGAQPELFMQLSAAMEDASTRVSKSRGVACMVHMAKLVCNSTLELIGHSWCVVVGMHLPSTSIPSKRSMNTLLRPTTCKPQSPMRFNMCFFLEPSIEQDTLRTCLYVVRPPEECELGSYEEELQTKLVCACGCFVVWVKAGEGTCLRTLRWRRGANLVFCIILRATLNTQPPCLSTQVRALLRYLKATGPSPLGPPHAKDFTRLLEEELPFMGRKLVGTVCERASELWCRNASTVGKFLDVQLT